MFVLTTATMYHVPPSNFAFVNSSALICPLLFMVWRPLRGPVPVLSTSSAENSMGCIARKASFMPTSSVMKRERVAFSNILRRRISAWSTSADFALLLFAAPRATAYGSRCRRRVGPAAPLVAAVAAARPRPRPRPTPSAWPGACVCGRSPSEANAPKTTGEGTGAAVGARTSPMGAWAEGIAKLGLLTMARLKLKIWSETTQRRTGVQP
mmetsp:Transcript_58560/g.148396  ORF Transcript_58560/g.148396 Transcript_58560/m.148396 type:complete len:210 (-) Transcript_58560:17-646(-)